MRRGECGLRRASEPVAACGDARGVCGGEGVAGPVRGGRAGDSWAPCAAPGLFAALAGLGCARGSPPPPSPDGR